MTVSVKEFDAVAKKICGNDLDGIIVPEWQRIMFLTETVAHNDCRYDREKQQALAQGINLMVGIFRNRFPGEIWNPEEIRWTTEGDAGVRGISPMLMAIAEL